MSDGETKVFTKGEVEEIATTAAQRALETLFSKLDIDANDSPSMKKLREDLNFLSEQREGSIILKSTLRKSAVYLATTAAVGMMYFTWDIIKAGVLSMFLHPGVH